MLVFFSCFIEVEGMVFCVEKYVVFNFDDDCWLYLLVLDLVKWIVVGDKCILFVGFYFFYEDVFGCVMV